MSSPLKFGGRVTSSFCTSVLRESSFFKVYRSVSTLSASSLAINNPHYCSMLYDFCRSKPRKKTLNLYNIGFILSLFTPYISQVFCASHMESFYNYLHPNRSLTGVSYSVNTQLCKYSSKCFKIKYRPYMLYFSLYFYVLQLDQLESLWRSGVLWSL